MALETILLFFLADLAICLTPGPATAVTASYGARGGVRAALGPIAGIHIGNFIWYALSALGLLTLLTTAPGTYNIIRWAGVVYLLWMGWRMIRSAKGSAKPDSEGEIAFWPGFGSGLAVHMSNPKALLFYASFLPQFIDPEYSVTFQILVFAGVTLITESIGLLVYSFAAASTKRAAVTRFGSLIFDKIAGTILICVAIIMALYNIPIFQQ
ncbi:MAG: LysE family translocator [Sphingorhabdus sp.]